mmetsp:Transcript_10121/g.28523  ORF Transcript_10121/g.28523 Transcript_10121/m.28523 type:complete len:335 (+) Transcript_10121:344-1348(+)
MTSGVLVVVATVVVVAGSVGFAPASCASALDSSLATLARKMLSPLDIIMKPGSLTSTTHFPSFAPLTTVPDGLMPRMSDAGSLESRTFRPWLVTTSHASTWASSKKVLAPFDIIMYPGSSTSLIHFPSARPRTIVSVALVPRTSAEECGELRTFSPWLVTTLHSRTAAFAADGWRGAAAFFASVSLPHSSSPGYLKFDTMVSWGSVSLSRIVPTGSPSLEVSSARSQSPTWCKTPLAIWPFGSGTLKRRCLPSSAWLMMHLERSLPKSQVPTMSASLLRRYTALCLSDPQYRVGRSVSSSVQGSPHRSRSTCWDRGSFAYWSPQMHFPASRSAM